jgi:hypothetical protein
MIRSIDQRRWAVALRLLPSGRIELSLRDGDRAAGELLTCTAPCQAVRRIEQFLDEYRTPRDELSLFAVLPGRDNPLVWSTHSAAAGLYWCATVLAHTWPPVWVPLVERRGTREHMPAQLFEPPLLERRRRAGESRGADGLKASAAGPS